MPALLTDIGFLPCVHTDVLDEVGLPHKLLVTHTAWESGLQRDAYNEKSKLENLIRSFTPMQSIIYVYWQDWIALLLQLY